MSKKVESLQEKREAYDEFRGLLKRILNDVGCDVKKRKL